VNDASLPSQREKAKDVVCEQTNYSKQEPALAPAPAAAATPVGSVPAINPAPVNRADNPQTHAQPEEESPLLLALRAYLDNQPAEAITHLGRYDQATQDLLICLLPIVVRASEGPAHSKSAHEISLVVAQLDRLADRQRSGAELTIEKMCFCKAFVCFGTYVPFPDENPRFDVGERVNLYVELKNFRSQWRDGFYTIEHKSAITFFDFKRHFVTGLPIDVERPDQSRSIRHDFAYKYSFPIPPMPPGFYTLVLRITDVPTGRTAQRTVDFEVKNTPRHGG
jgi:hypothetical protein